MTIKPHQHAFAFCDENPARHSSLKLRRTGAFTDNMRLPIHRWFRYSAGFSAEWAADIIETNHLCRDKYVLDPFAGAGTTLLAAHATGANVIGVENHEFVYRIAKAKLAWNVDENELLKSSDALLERARSITNFCAPRTEALLVKCYGVETLRQLESLRQAYLTKHSAPTPINELLWLAITAILRECSCVGTAQWQYILPNKIKARSRAPFLAFQSRIQLFCSDIGSMRRSSCRTNVDLRFGDARAIAKSADLHGRVGLVITSPPYPNNYDYADATRLELTFWGEIENWGDLQRTIRHRLIRSCSQQASIEKLSLRNLLSDAAIAPIRKELTQISEELAEIRETKGGKKAYHTMVAAYFLDLSLVWRALNPLCAPGARVCFVIGDSAPYGIHVPVERLLGELALAAGFKNWAFEKIRDRNTKWKNRKHRVPLKEGNLWVEN